MQSLSNLVSEFPILEDENIMFIENTKEAGVIYRSKFGSAGISPKFWGIVDTYMECLYTKF